LLAGFDTFGAFCSGVLTLMLGLAGSELGFFTGSYSVGFVDESIGFVGMGWASFSGNFEGAMVFEFTTGRLNLSKITPSVAGGEVGIGFGVRFK
jgi:hypothetical protein